MNLARRDFLVGTAAILAATTLPGLHRVLAVASPTQAMNPAIASKRIFEHAPFAQCHASTIVQARSGELLSAWFGGTAEGKPDVGIWLSRHGASGWTPPIEVALSQMVDGVRLPCWNPVLFQPRSGPLMLFYKLGAHPDRWWGMLMTSADSGVTWSRPQRLPEGMLGPIKNKPMQLATGEILCPSSREDGGWRAHVEITDDRFERWQTSKPVPNGKIRGAIQPSILVHRDGRLQMLCRTAGDGVIAQSWSTDRGRTWSEMSATTLPNPNSGTDAVTLADGRHLLVYNPTASARSPLALAISEDGRKWRDAATLETQPGEFSYPAIIQAADGLVYITYTSRRRHIQHAVVDPKRI